MELREPHVVFIDMLAHGIHPTIVVSSRHLLKDCCPRTPLEWLRFVVGPYALYRATVSRDPQRNYATYQLFHTLSNTDLFLRAVRSWFRYGLTPLDNVNKVPPAVTHRALRWAFMAWVSEMVWMIRVREWSGLLTHHIPLLAFAPWAFQVLPSAAVSLLLLEGQSVPKALYVVQACLGLPHTSYKRWSHWLRIPILLFVRLRVLGEGLSRTTHPTKRAFMGLLVALDVRTLFQTVRALQKH